MASTKASHGVFFIKNGQRAAKVQALPVFLIWRVFADTAQPVPTGASAAVFLSKAYRSQFLPFFTRNASRSTSCPAAHME